MSLLSEALNEYVAMRRNLGFVFRVPASLLRTFVAFVDQAGSPVITTELARQWALQPTGAQPSTWAGRLAIARRFAVWRRASDLRTEVPPADAVGQRYRRTPPRFYRDQDVVHLMQNAAAYRPPRNSEDVHLPPYLDFWRSPACGSTKRSISIDPTSTWRRAYS